MLARAPVSLAASFRHRTGSSSTPASWACGSSCSPKSCCSAACSAPTPSIGPTIREIFVYAHQFLDKNLGAINTGVLILSSLTMAWGVRCAQTRPAARPGRVPGAHAALRLRRSGHQVRRVQGKVGGRAALGQRDFKPTRSRPAEVAPPARSPIPAIAAGRPGEHARETSASSSASISS